MARIDGGEERERQPGREGMKAGTGRGFRGESLARSERGSKAEEGKKTGTRRRWEGREGSEGEMLTEEEGNEEGKDTRRLKGKC